MESIIATCLMIVTLIGVMNGITASKFESIANMKGHSGYWGWCFLFGAIGWAMVIALPDRKQECSIQNFENANGNIAPETDDTLPEL